LRGSFARTRERLDDYTTALQNHGLDSVEREVRWLNELIDDETNRKQTTTPSSSEASSLGDTTKE
jgi:hypothetical protein